MGFRFSKRVKVLPGISLNFSTGGVSLSTGVKSARITFGPRGTHANFGIPGTGLSYRQRLDGGGRSTTTKYAPLVLPKGDAQNDAIVHELVQGGDQVVSLKLDDLKRYMDDPRIKLSDPQTGRKYSRRQLEAKIREMECEREREAAREQIEKEEKHYQAILNHWHPLPEIPDHEGFLQALNKQPYPYELPQESDYAEQQRLLVGELTQEFKRGWVYRFLPEFLSRQKAQKELSNAWPQREAALQADYAQRVEQFNQDTTKWDQQEAARVESLKKLRAGDLAETHRWAVDLVGSLAFPFETHCEVFLQDAQSVYIHLDLPEIEDVIPAMQQMVSKAGERREVNRKRGELNADYAYLVIGQCILIAAALFACLPLAGTVQVAAYTQRPRVRESDPVDTYILDVTFSRTHLQRFDPPKNLISYVIKLGGRINPLADNELGPIESPSWIESR